MKSEIPVTFESPQLEPLPIELKAVAQPQKPKPKDKKALAEAQAFAKFGVQVLRVKARVLAALGKEAESCGIKQIGHGKILIAAENAEAAISRLGVIIDGLLKKDPVDYPLILEVMQMQKEFNSQIIKTAEAHFSADKQPVHIHPAVNGINIPYPAGAPIMIGVGKVPGANGTGAANGA